ncbi:ABC transporter ATP-binding protein [Paenibacillus pinistramenti]|uniref:ABC transporter ATP-binding protein n=1 Tax=Paenibacillus pinistramenti TaxID=1768003 RepID=UPI001107DCC9|nr:ABC transporter ATP-binding protein [Paenibacillus pinistramenti]
MEQQTVISSAAQIRSGQPVLEVRSLRKRIGRKWIIEDVSFTVYGGEIFGFLGPNGAGKTTTIRMLVNLIKPTAGSIQIGGYDVRSSPEKALGQIGAIVENPEVYAYLTGWENLEQFGRMLKGVDEARIKEVTELVRLDKRIHDKVRTYSLGMRQRLGIAQALLGRPKLLILDEPTNGLDPKGIKEMRDFIRRLAEQGMAVFVSSHLLSEIQLLCDRVAIISSGKVLAEGRVDELIQNRSNYVVWDVEPRARALEILSNNQITVLKQPETVLDDSVMAGIPEGAIVCQMEGSAMAGYTALFAEEGLRIQSVYKINPTLEQLFLEMTGGESID